MAGALFYVNPTCFDFIIKRYLGANPTFTSGSFTEEAASVKMTFEAAPPTVDLSRDANHVGFVFSSVVLTSYDLTTNPPTQLSTGTASLTAVGALSLTGNTLHVSQFTVTGGADFLDKVAASIFSTKLLPHLATVVQNLPLPNLSSLTNISIALNSLSVENGVVAVDATIGNVYGPRPNVSAPSVARPIVYCAISSDTVQGLARTAASFPVRKSDGDSGHIGFWKASVRWSASVNASADSVDVTIADSHASGVVHVSAGGDVSIEGHGPSVSVSAHSPSLTINAAIVDGTVEVSFALADPVSLIPSCSGLIGDIEDKIKGFASQVTSQLQGAINDKLSAATIKAFTLPTSIEAFGVNATLRFGNVAFLGDSATTEIELG